MASFRGGRGATGGGQAPGGGANPQAGGNWMDGAAENLFRKQDQNQDGVRRLDGSVHAIASVCGVVQAEARAAELREEPRIGHRHAGRARGMRRLGRARDRHRCLHDLRAPAVTSAESGA